MNGERRRTELSNMGKEGRGSIHSCRNSWTSSFSNIMISQRQSLRGAHSICPPCMLYALQWHIVPMSPHAAKRVTRGVRIQSRDRDRETDKCRRRIASLVLGREGQKPPSRTQREVISAARTVVDVVQGEVLYDFYAKSRKINGFSLP